MGFNRSQGLEAFSKLSPTDLGGITELFGSDSWNWLLRKDLEFHEIQLEAKRLDQQVSPSPIGCPTYYKYSQRLVAA